MKAVKHSYLYFSHAEDFHTTLFATFHKIRTERIHDNNGVEYWSFSLFHTG